MDDRNARDAQERGPERAIARELKAAAASRRPPEPPSALREIAWGRTGGESSPRPREGRSAGRAGAAIPAADLAWAAALAACLACSVAFGRVDTELARRLDDPAISRSIRDAFAPSSLEALELRIGGDE